jgi:hypothetical protein
VKNLFRIIFRWLTGDLFFILFLLFSLLTIVRFRLLKADFWIGTFKDTQIYDQISLESKKAVGDNPLAAQMVRGLTPDFFQDIVETNLTRLEGFFVGKDTSLFLYAPVNKSGLPKQMFQKPPLSQLSEKTDLAVFLNTISGSPEAGDESWKTVVLIRQIISYLPLVWLVALLLSGLLLGLHFWLGKTLKNRLWGSGILLFISGVTIAITAKSVPALVSEILPSIKMIPLFLLPVIKTALEKAMEPDQKIGFWVAGVGAVAAVVSFLIKNKEVAKPVKKPAGKRKKIWLVLLAGVIGLIVLGVAGGKLRFSTQITRSGQGEKPFDQSLLTDKPYVSNYGWSMRYPKDWKVEDAKDKEEVGFMKPKEAFFFVDKSSWNPLGDNEEVYTTAIKDYLSKSKDYQQLKFIREPKESQWKGFRRISMETQHYLPKDKINVNEFWSLLFRQNGQGAFMMIGRAPSSKWQAYGPLIENSFETFMEQ